jgi:anti-sigma regulatory factor (Ser/Thr protein kinase)
VAATIQHPASGLDEALGASVWDGAEATLAPALAPPTIRCVEACLLPQWRASRAEAGGLLSLTVSTRTAFRLPIVKPFIDGIEARLALPKGLRVRIHTVLHETLMNAILHGNLALDSALRDSFGGLATLQDIIEARLLLPQLALKAIGIQAAWNDATLDVSVHDNGAGFERRPMAVDNESDEAGASGSGRGLAIVEALSDGVLLLDGGTTIKMGFNL